MKITTGITYSKRLELSPAATKASMDASRANAGRKARSVGESDGVRGALWPASQVPRREKGGG